MLSSDKIILVIWGLLLLWVHHSCISRFSLSRKDIAQAMARVISSYLDTEQYEELEDVRLRSASLFALNLTLVVISFVVVLFFLACGILSFDSKEESGDVVVRYINTACLVASLLAQTLVARWESSVIPKKIDVLLALVDASAFRHS